MKQTKPGLVRLLRLQPGNGVGSILTGNVTTITKVRSASARLFAGMWRPLVSVITTLYLLCYYYCSSSKVVVECGVAHFLCAMCVFDIWASSSSPRLPLCQILFRSQLYCLASPWRKTAYSVTQ